MKTQHIALLTITAAVLAACVPSTSSPDSTATPSSSSSRGAEVPAPQVPGESKVPVGRRTPDGKTNMVISPFRPYNVIDVKGYRSGDIVGDPSTAQTNSATGKLNLNTSKHFRIP